MPNQGQQRLPIALSNGLKTVALFQVAEVSRPLVSVARMCEAGNRVIFGVAGGVIRNIATGVDTPFRKSEGVYIFEMWVPPVNQFPGFAGQP